MISASVSSVIAAASDHAGGPEQRVNVETEPTSSSLLPEERSGGAEDLGRRGGVGVKPIPPAEKSKARSGNGKRPELHSALFDSARGCCVPPHVDGTSAARRRTAPIPAAAAGQVLRSESDAS